MKKKNTLRPLVWLPMLFLFSSTADMQSSFWPQQNFSQSVGEEADAHHLNYSSPMVIQKEIIIHAEIEKCWQLLGIDFAHADRWASAVHHSEGKGVGFNGAVCSERSCSTTLGGLKEKLLEFSPEKHRLKYEVAEGMPSMVRYATNDWQLTALDNKQTRLVMKVEMQIGGIMGTVMKPVMRSKMSKLTGQIGEEFKFYVENGKPHPRKVKAMQKAG